MKETTKNGWRKTGWFFYSLSPCVAYLVLNVLASFLGGVFFGLIGYMTGVEDMYGYIMDKIMVISIGFAVVALISFGLWYYFGCRRPSPRIPKGVFSVRVIVGIIVAALGLQFVTTGISTVSGLLFPDALDFYVDLIESAGLNDTTWVTVLYAVFLGPIAEEIAFRGLTFYIARRFTNRFWLANCIQALMFGVMHANLIQGIYAFCVGLALGWIYWHFRSIYASMLAHIVFNLLGTVVLEPVFAMVPDTMLTVALISIAGIGICIGSYFMMGKGAREQTHFQSY